MGLLTLKFDRAILPFLKIEMRHFIHMGKNVSDMTVDTVTLDHYKIDVKFAKIATGDIAIS